MTNIHPIFDQLLTRQDREKRLDQKGVVLWFTGLSGSGKSTIAAALEKALFNRGLFPLVLDGDNVRSGVCNNLGFSLDDRKENIRRISEVAKLFKDSGIITLCSFISPTENIRKSASNIIGGDDFKLIFVEASLKECEKRDVKGLYKKARAGEITGFSGIDSPFDIPAGAWLSINTEKLSVENSVELILTKLIENNIIS